MLTLSSKRMPPMPSKSKTYTVASSAGFSVAGDGFRNVKMQDMNKYNKTFASFLPMCSVGDVMVCVECVETEVRTVTLINQRCTYWPNCMRGDACLFLHEEEATSAVFHDGTDSPAQTRAYTVTKTVYKMRAAPVSTPVDAAKDSVDEPDDMDVRIYVSNIPGTMSASELKAMAECFGEVVFVKLLSSSVASGRRAGFVDMMSLRSAYKAIDFIKTQWYEDTQLMAKIERKRPLCKKPIKEEKKVDDDGFTTVSSSVARRGKATPSYKAAVTSSSSTLFSTLTEEALDEVPPPVATKPAPKSLLRVVAPKKEEPAEEWPLIKGMAVSPVSVMAAWLETERIDKVRASPITDKSSGMTPRTAPSPVNLLPPPFVAPRALMPALVTARQWDPVLSHESWDADYDRAAADEAEVDEVADDLEIDFDMDATDNWEDRF